ncbi:fimbrial protein [Burkholderia pyrrocinia]
MTKNYIYSAAIGGVIALLSPIAQAADGTISFTGAISASTCKVAASPATVKLPNADADAVKNKDEPAGATPFTITLSGCGQPGKVATQFDPIKVNPDTGNLVPNSGTGQATNVEIGLYNNDLTKKLNLSKPDAAGQGSAQGDIKSGQDTTLRYYAAYLGNGQPATAGTVSASTMFTMDYQ